jgi:hypothetical protein
MRSIVFALALLASGSAQARPERRFVIVVANNRSVTPGVAPLTWADDDGARWYELLAPSAEAASLFTVLDEESQRQLHDDALLAEAPTRAAIFARLADYNRRMDAARAEGADPVLTLVLIGHGEVAPDGEGFLSLLGAPRRRGELLRDVIATSRAAFNHLIIDACNSYLLVARRGADKPDAEAAAAIHRYVAEEDLARYPNTGVFLSTSRAEVSHEWSEYGGGVFSHELRSALTGAADVNGDGRVEYSEAKAFVASANLQLDDPRARLDVYVRPPALDRGRALMDLGASHLRHFLVLPKSLSGRFYLEDARGVRYADFNKAAEQQVIIGLVDSAAYYLRDGERELTVSLRRPGAVQVRDSAWRARTLAARGSIVGELSLKLFRTPFGPSFYRGFVASTGDTPVGSGTGAFVPPSAEDSVRAHALESRLTDFHRRLDAPSARDRYARTLLDWADRRLGASDLDELERTLRALEAITRR